MKEIVSHTAFRGISALFVVLYHYLPDSGAGTIFERAHIGVDLFFILSGFILSHVYSHFLSGSKPISYREFFAHRVARIYPLYLATFLFMLAIVVYKSGGFPSEMTWPAVTTLFGVQAWGLSDQYYFNFPAWSVSGELAAYLLFPVFAYLWRKKINLLLVAALVAGSYLALHITHGELDLDERLMGIRAPLGFLLGMLVYSYKGWAEQIGRLSLAQAVTIAACIAIFSFGLTDYLLIPLLALLVLLTWQDKGLLSAALNNRVFRALGIWSYGIYLLHIPVRSAANFVRPHFPIGDYEYIVLLVALTVLASWLSFKYFETPMRRAVRDRLMRRSIKPVVTANA